MRLVCSLKENPSTHSPILSNPPRRLLYSTSPSVLPAETTTDYYRILLPQDCYACMRPTSAPTNYAVLLTILAFCLMGSKYRYVGLYLIIFSSLFTASVSASSSAIVFPSYTSGSCDPAESRCSTECCLDGFYSRECLKPALKAAMRDSIDFVRQVLLLIDASCAQPVVSPTLSLIDILSSPTTVPYASETIVNDPTSDSDVLLTAPSSAVHESPVPLSDDALPQTPTSSSEGVLAWWNSSPKVHHPEFSQVSVQRPALFFSPVPPKKLDWLKAFHNHLDELFSVAKSTYSTSYSTYRYLYWRYGSQYQSPVNVPSTLLIPESIPAKQTTFSSVCSKSIRAHTTACAYYCYLLKYALPHSANPVSKLVPALRILKQVTPDYYAETTPAELPLTHSSSSHHGVSSEAPSALHLNTPSCTLVFLHSYSPSYRYLCGSQFVTPIFSRTTCLCAKYSLDPSTLRRLSIVSKRGLKPSYNSRSGYCSLTCAGLTGVQTGLQAFPSSRKVLCSCSSLPRPAGDCSSYSTFDRYCQSICYDIPIPFDPAAPAGLCIAPTPSHGACSLNCPALLPGDLHVIVTNSPIDNCCSQSHVRVDHPDFYVPGVTSVLYFSTPNHFISASYFEAYGTHLGLHNQHRLIVEVHETSTFSVVPTEYGSVPVRVSSTIPLNSKGYFFPTFALLPYTPSLYIDQAITVGVRPRYGYIVPMSSDEYEALTGLPITSTCVSHKLLLTTATQQPLTSCVTSSLTDLLCLEESILLGDDTAIIDLDCHLDPHCTFYDEFITEEVCGNSTHDPIIDGGRVTFSPKPPKLRHNPPYIFGDCTPTILATEYFSTLKHVLEHVNSNRLACVNLTAMSYHDSLSLLFQLYYNPLASTTPPQFFYTEPIQDLMSIYLSLPEAKMTPDYMVHAVLTGSSPVDHKALTVTLVDHLQSLQHITFRSVLNTFTDVFGSFFSSCPLPDGLVERANSSCIFHESCSDSVIMQGSHSWCYHVSDEGHISSPFDGDLSKSASLTQLLTLIHNNHQGVYVIKTSMDPTPIFDFFDISLPVTIDPLSLSDTLLSKSGISHIIVVVDDHQDIYTRLSDEITNPSELWLSENLSVFDL